ncbi:hypothetical protein AAVH_33469 [Aphelenchoides avenae]|nr:hypothetical protein AAVH_33469 [Aphelenchus avenae]
MAFDAYCPTTKGKVASQTCAICRRYFPTKKALVDHRKERVSDGGCPIASQSYALLESDEDETAGNELDETMLTDEATNPVVDPRQA